MKLRCMVVFLLLWLPSFAGSRAQQTEAELEPDRSYKLLREDEDWSFLRDRRLREDFKARTWEAGIGLDNIRTDGWPDGRAGFVLSALQNATFDQVVADLPPEDQIWIGYRAA